jgi:hypothetical protein
MIQIILNNEVIALEIFTHALICQNFHQFQKKLICALGINIGTTIYT